MPETAVHNRHRCYHKQKSASKQLYNRNHNIEDFTGRQTASEKGKYKSIPKLMHTVSDSYGTLLLRATKGI